MNTVTYTLENGTKIVQPINKQAFVNENGHHIIAIDTKIINNKIY